MVQSLRAGLWGIQPPAAVRETVRSLELEPGQWNPV